MGNTNPSDGYGGSTDPALRLWRFQASSDAVYYEIVIDIVAGGDYVPAVYADDGTGTSPTSLLSRTGLIHAVVSGWNNIPLGPPVTVVSGQYYWLGATHQATMGGIGYSVGNVVDGLQMVDTLNDLPAVFSGYLGIDCPPCNGRVYITGCPAL